MYHLPTLWGQEVYSEIRNTRIVIYGAMAMTAEHLCYSLPGWEIKALSECFHEQNMRKLIPTHGVAVAEHPVICCFGRT